MACDRRSIINHAWCAVVVIVRIVEAKKKKNVVEGWTKKNHHGIWNVLKELGPSPRPNFRRPCSLTASQESLLQRPMPEALPRGLHLGLVHLHGVVHYFL
jgi:hypothetical protein